MRRLASSGPRPLVSALRLLLAFAVFAAPFFALALALAFAPFVPAFPGFDIVVRFPERLLHRGCMPPVRRAGIALKNAWR